MHVCIHVFVCVCVHVCVQETHCDKVYVYACVFTVKTTEKGYNLYMKKKIKRGGGSKYGRKRGRGDDRETEKDCA